MGKKLSSKHIERGIRYLVSGAGAGKTLPQIAGELGVSCASLYDSAYKYLDTGTLEVLRRNGKRRQISVTHTLKADANRVRTRDRNRKFPIRDTRAGLKLIHADRCKNCGKTSGEGRLERHHIKPVAYDSKWRLVPGRRMDNRKSNIIILCTSCHRKWHFRNKRKIS